MSKRKTEKQKEMLDEIKYIALSFIAVFIFLKIFYYKESIIKVLLLVLGIFYLFIIPGFMLLHPLREKIPRFPRLLLAFGLGLGTEGLLAYYLNIIFGVPVFPYAFIYPAVIVVISLYFNIFFNYRNEKK